MGWKAFFASVIHSLAWPGALAFTVYLLRAAIRKRIEKLRSLRYRGAEAEFGEVVREAEITATRAELPPPDAPIGEPALSTELSGLIRSAPRAAVIEAWLAVEQELEALAVSNGLEPDPRYPTATALIRQLVTSEVIDRSTADVIDELRAARNVAVHARPYVIEEDVVWDYVTLAGRVRAALRRADDLLPPPLP
jgi:hypothetical protein